MKNLFLVLTLVMFVLLQLMSELTFNCAPIVVDFTMWIIFCTMMTTLFCYVKLAVNDDVEE